MDSYIIKNLQPNEKLIHLSRAHWIIFAPTVATVVMSLVLFLIVDGSGIGGMATWIMTGLLVIASIQFVQAWAYYVSTELGVTNQRVVGKIGLFSRNVVEIDLDRIDAITVHQPFVIGMLFNFGTVIVKGLSGTPIPVHTISHPMDFRNARPIRPHRPTSANR